MAHAVVATGYGDPDVLDVVEVDPGEPGPGQVLLEVRAAGVNPADWKQYSGAWGTDPDALPMRLGHEASGVVRAVGPGTEGVAVGDEVIAYRAPGAYADQVVVDEDALFLKPPQLSWEKAAGLMLTGVTAAHCLAATRVGAGDTVLVHGAAGGVGAMVVQLCRARGARVVGTADPADHDYITHLGALPVTYGSGLADRVRAAVHAVDAAIDTAGTREALDVSVDLVPDKHRVATVAGFAHGAALGVRLLGSGPGADPGTQVRRDARAGLVRMVERGVLDVRVGATYPLRDAARAHRAGIAGRVRGKLILAPGRSPDVAPVPSRSRRRLRRDR